MKVWRNKNIREQIGEKSKTPKMRLFSYKLNFGSGSTTQVVVVE